MRPMHSSDTFWCIKKHWSSICTFMRQLNWTVPGPNNLILGINQSLRINHICWCVERFIVIKFFTSNWIKLFSLLFPIMWWLEDLTLDHQPFHFPDIYSASQNTIDQAKRFLSYIFFFSRSMPIFIVYKTTLIKEPYFRQSWPKPESVPS